MNQRNYKITLCADEKSSVSGLSFTFPVTSAIGYFDTVYPVLINRVQNKNRGKLDSWFKNDCAMIQLSTQDLQIERLKQTLKP